MRILLSNDDGCMAPGLLAMARHLRVEHHVDIVAPDRNRSAASNSLTILVPLRVQRHDDGSICVDGTPTDCVHLALASLLPEKPEMVVSGINNGPNLGDDTLYSGTVAAAMEGRHLGSAAIAVSMSAYNPKHYDTGARATMQIIAELARNPFPGHTILNVNVPDVPWEDLKGFEVTRLGHRRQSEPVAEALDPRGRPIYWIGAAGPGADAGEGTDFHAVENNRVSITPLLVDLTRHTVIDKLKQWATAL